MHTIKLEMRKISVITTSIVAFFSNAASALAQATNNSSIQISRPDVGYSNISDFLNASIRLIFIAALLLALVMLVWGAVEWILSGGDKTKLETARGRIIHALVGLAILAVAFAIIQLAGRFLGVDLLGNFIIPSPSAPTPAIPR